MEFKFRAGDDRPSSSSSTVRYFSSERTIRGQSVLPSWAVSPPPPPPRSSGRPDPTGFPNPDYFTIHDPILHPANARDALQRQMEKDRIREEILAAEMARRRVLEAEVRRELMMEREIAMKKAVGDGLGFEDPFGPMQQAQSFDHRVGFSSRSSSPLAMVPRLPEPVPDNLVVNEELTAPAGPPELNNEKLILLAKPNPDLSGLKRKKLPSEGANEIYQYTASVCWINTVCYVVCLRNFPFHQQVAVGLTTSYQGLSAKIYTDIVSAFFSSSPHKRARAYLLLNSLLPLIVCAVVAPFVRDIDVVTGKQPRNMATGFRLMFVITIATGIYAVITSLGSMIGLDRMIGTGVFLLIPLVIPIAEKIRDILSRRWSLADRENKVYNVSIDDQNGLESIESGVVKEEEEEEHTTTVQVHNEVSEVQVQHGFGVREEIGVKLMVRRIDFWLYFLVYFFSATIGLVFLNTLGQITESRGSSKTSSLVSLSSSFGFFGRLMPSLLDYFFARSKYMISRPAFLVALAAPIAGVFFLLLNPANISLIISTAVIGVCTGAITSIAVSITTELFGTKKFSINHNVVVANISIGSFLFGYSSALLYRKEGNDDGSCLGMACYRGTFIIWGSLCTLGTVLALTLYARTRKFYSKRS